jgi:hypothetical protein
MTGRHLVIHLVVIKTVYRNIEILQPKTLSLIYINQMNSFGSFGYFIFLFYINQMNSFGSFGYYFIFLSILTK